MIKGSMSQYTYIMDDVISEIDDIQKDLTSLKNIINTKYSLSEYKKLVMNSYKYDNIVGKMIEVEQTFKKYFFVKSWWKQQFGIELKDENLIFKDNLINYIQKNEVRFFIQIAIEFTVYYEQFKSIVYYKENGDGNWKPIILDITEAIFKEIDNLCETIKEFISNYRFTRYTKINKDDIIEILIRFDWIDINLETFFDKYLLRTWHDEDLVSIIKDYKNYEVDKNTKKMLKKLLKYLKMSKYLRKELLDDDI